MTDPKKLRALVEKWRSWEYLSGHVSDSSTQAFTQAAYELSTLLTEAERPTVEPAEMSTRQAALLDSQFRAGAKAGWNAAQLDDPAEADAAIARLIRVNEGDMAVFKAERPTPPVEDAVCRQCRQPRSAHCDLDEPGVDHSPVCGKMHHEFKPQEDAVTRAKLEEAAREFLAAAEDYRIHSEVLFDGDISYTIRMLKAREALRAHLKGSPE
jgi:hypothetical protein